MEVVKVVFSSIGAVVVSSASSVISFNLRRRSEDDEDVSEPVDCKDMIHRPRLESVSSDDLVKEKTVSLGVKLSRMDWNCTVRRTVEWSAATQPNEVIGNKLTL